MERNPSNVQSIEVLTSEVPVANHDIFISEELLNLFPRLRPVLHSEGIEKLFARQEALANKWKHIFVTLGSISLVVVCALLILLSWRLSLVGLSIQFPAIVDYVAAVAGIAALAIQLFLGISRAHSRWLYARFATELIRLWKYQSFLDGNFMELLNGPLASFNKELADRWTLFTARFRGGSGGMEDFIESSPFELMVARSSYRADDLYREARKAYQTFRLDVQIAHLAYKNKTLETVDSWTNAAAKFSLLLSGLIVVIDACLLGARAIGWVDVHGGTGGASKVTAALAGLALSFAVISAGVRVYRGAAAITEERERYRFKQLHLRRIDDQLRQVTDQNTALALMERAEIVCTEELQEFLKALSHADYFF
jgi:ABC-type multidrug transport system fused ATPase/permease subunit